MSGSIRPTDHRLARKLPGFLLWLLLGPGCASMTGTTPSSAALPYQFSLGRAGGGRVSFERFRGRVVLVDFFHTWNQASVVSIAGYSGLYRRYHEKGLEIVGVALDDLGELVVEPFSRGMDIPYPVALADEALRRGESPFGQIGATPLLLIFDREGSLAKIFVGHVPTANVEEVVRDLLP